MSYTQKCMKKWQNSNEKCFNFETGIGIILKFLYLNLKSEEQNAVNFLIFIFRTDWENNLSKTSGPERARPGRFMTDIKYMARKKLFLAYKPYQKNQ